MVMINTRMAISTAPRVIGWAVSTPLTVEVTSHSEIFSRKLKAEWISDHKTITDTSAISVRIERTSRSDWALMVSVSISE